MSHTQHETEFRTDLTSERLSIVGRALAEARDSAQRDAKPNLGDDSWSVGCTAFSRCRGALEKLAVENPNWMSVTCHSMEFVFQIGAVPVRFFHGEVEDATEHHAYATPVEINALRQLELGFPSTMAPATISGLPCHRFVLHTEADGYTSSVSFVGVADGQVVSQRTVWSRTASPAVASLPQGEELPPPSVSYLGSERLSAAEDGA